MSKRIPSRQRNGRYRRATLENTFGLKAPVCPHCRGLNPHGINEPAPEVCGQCGKPMKKDTQKHHCLSCGMTVEMADGDEFPRDDERCSHQFEPSVEDFAEWTPLMLIRQWWYVYLQYLKQGGRYPGWLNEMTKVCEERGIIKKGIPMTTQGAEDLVAQVNEFKKHAH